MRAGSAGAVIQKSISDRVVRMAGIALGWITPPSLLGSVVRTPKISFVVFPSLTFLTEVQVVQNPAKKARGRVSTSLALAKRDRIRRVANGEHGIGSFDAVGESPRHEQQALVYGRLIGS